MTPFEQRILELMNRRGISREEAIANQQNAINQGYDLNGDGAVLDSEWGRVQELLSTGMTFEQAIANASVPTASVNLEPEPSARIKQEMVEVDAPNPNQILDAIPGTRTPFSPAPNGPFPSRPGYSGFETPPGTPNTPDNSGFDNENPGTPGGPDLDITPPPPPVTPDYGPSNPYEYPDYGPDTNPDSGPSTLPGYNLNDDQIDNINDQIADNLSDSPLDQRIRQLMVERGWTYEEALENQTNAVNQGADLDGDGAVTSEEWSQWNTNQNDPLADLEGIFLQRIQELMERGMSAEEAIRNQQGAIQQGADLNQDGIVTDQEWGDFTGTEQNPPDPVQPPPIGGDVPGDVYVPPVDDPVTDPVDDTPPWDNNADPDDPSIFDPDVTDDLGLDDPVDDAIDDIVDEPDNNSGGGDSSSPDFGIFVGGLLNDLFSNDGEDMSTFEDFLDAIIGGDTGSSASANNFLSDLLTQTINIGASDYAADQYRDALQQQINYNQGIYNQNVDRLDPYNQVGLNAISATEAAGNQNPTLADTLSGQFSLNPNTSVSGPQSGPQASISPVDTNLQANTVSPQSQAQVNPVEVNRTDVTQMQDNPFYQAMLSAGNRNIQDAAAAQGKLNSGGTLKALSDSAAALYGQMMPQFQQIQASQDATNLAANNQAYSQGRTNQVDDFGQQLAQANYGTNVDQANVQNALQGNQQLFGQQTTNQTNDFMQQLAAAQFAQGQGQQNFSNALMANDQLFSQLFSNNNQALGADAQEFGQLYQLLGGGQSAAAGQGGYGNALMQANQNPMATQAGATGAQWAGIINQLFGI